MSLQKLLPMILVGGGSISALLGIALMTDFETKPGVAPAPPAYWPIASKIARATGQSQLVVFAHPRCSCTTATLEELAPLSLKNVAVLFFRPKDRPDWEGSAGWETAKLITGANLSWDSEGAEAKLFGSVTSGSVLLYGPAGNLQFHGGITAVRGHAGPNAGLDRLISALRSGRTSDSVSSVFGCSLRGAA